MADLPWAPDVALVTVGREACVEAVEALAARGCRHAVLYAAGFAELSPDGARLQDRMVAAARTTGMRLLGPNCMSLWVARSRLNLTGIPDLRPGRLAFVSQSGNLVYDLVEHGRRSGLGLSVFLSLGNQADLGFEDVLDAVLDDPDTAAVALYVEAVRPGRGRAFLEAVHRLARAKPVVALIGGRTDSGRRASASHTAALLSDVRELRGLLRQAGAIEVTRLDELFPVADTLVKSPPPPVPTVALCGGGGGHATVGSDALEAHGIVLPPPAPETQQALRAIFPPMASVRNPIDWTGASDRSFWAYRDAARLLLADRGIGGLILFGHFGGYLTDLETPANNYRDVAVALGALQRETGKPVLLHSIYAHQRRAAFDALRDADVPLFESLEVAAAAYRALVERGRVRERGPLPALVTGVDDRLAPHAARARAEGRRALLEPEAWAWLESLGLPVGPRCWATTAEDAVSFAAAQTGPVAVKLVSAAILHKSDVGGVRLDVDGAAAVRAAFADLHAVTTAHRADFRGVLVVPMAGPGVDVALGVARSELGGHVAARWLGRHDGRGARRRERPSDSPHRGRRGRDARRDARRACPGPPARHAATAARAASRSHRPPLGGERRLDAPRGDRPQPGPRGRGGRPDPGRPRAARVLRERPWTSPRPPGSWRSRRGPAPSWSRSSSRSRSSVTPATDSHRTSRLAPAPQLGRAGSSRPTCRPSGAGRAWMSSSR